MKAILAITLAAALTGCANMSHVQQNIVPLVDTKGADMTNFYNDVAECNNYARAVDAEQQAANGAVAMGLVGALLGAALGNHKDALQLGLIGAASGAVQAGNKAVEKKEDIVARCMQQRGWRVIG